MACSPKSGYGSGIVLGSNPAFRQSSTTVAEKPGDSGPPDTISVSSRRSSKSNARARGERVRSVDVDDRGFVPEALALECVVGRCAEGNDEVKAPGSELTQQDASRLLAGVEHHAGGLGCARGDELWGEPESCGRRYSDPQRADRARSTSRTAEKTSSA